MSRSFPCPTSLYARNWANVQNLVESTKIKRDIVGQKKALRKKEKKEKRKDKKEKHRYLTSNKVQDENEQLEKSGLTEEHEQPQHLCYLSDGSQSNNKRKRQDPPVDSHVKVVPGKPLRIRFVFRKPKVPEALAQEEPVCSTLGSQCTQTEEVVQNSQASCVAKAGTSEQEEDLPCTSGGGEGTTIPIDTRKKKHKRSKESRYNALFDEWVPLPLSSAVLDLGDDDQDWLLPRRRQRRPANEVLETDKDSTNLQCSGDPSWPKALFLPEVGIYSLPYEMPF